MSDVMLRLSHLTCGYDARPVLHGIDLEIRTGQVAVLLGLNGAGKTTTALSISGALRTWDGRIEFAGDDVTRWTTQTRVRAGIVLVPEGRRVFRELNVDRNLEIGAWCRRRDRTWVRDQRDRVFGYFPRLADRASQLAGNLSGGEQQVLAIGRALMAGPRLLVIDEASMGLSPALTQQVFGVVQDIARTGTTVLLIEQGPGALDVADTGFVIEQGHIVRRLHRGDRAGASELLFGNGHHPRRAGDGRSGSARADGQQSIEERVGEDPVGVEVVERSDR